MSGKWNTITPEMRQEMLQGLYRERLDATIDGEQNKVKTGQAYQIGETHQSVQGRPERHFWTVEYK